MKAGKEEKDDTSEVLKSSYKTLFFTVKDVESYSILKMLPEKKENIIKAFNKEYDFLFRTDNPDRDIANKYITEMLENKIIVEREGTLHQTKTTEDILKFIDTIVDISIKGAVESVRYQFFTREI